MSEGFVPADNPCCGVHAVAEASEVPFQSIWNIAKFTVKKKASWRGRTTYNERLAILNSIGAIHSPQANMVGKTLIEAAYLAKGEGNYIFDLSGHSVAFKHGRFIDQGGSYHPTQYKYRFHYLKHATRVIPVTDFDEDLIWDNLACPLDFLE